MRTVGRRNLPKSVQQPPQSSIVGGKELSITHELTTLGVHATVVYEAPKIKKPRMLKLNDKPIGPIKKKYAFKYAHLFQ